MKMPFVVSVDGTSTFGSSTYEPLACAAAAVPFCARVTVHDDVPAPAVTSITSRFATLVGPSWTTILNEPDVGKPAKPLTVSVVPPIPGSALVVVNCATSPTNEPAA